MSDSPTYQLGIDIGGTFTDFALVNTSTGDITKHKESTTPSDPAKAAVAGAREVVHKAKADWKAVSRVVHGTTLVANAIVERKGARTALVVTEGFRDILEMGRENRYDVYNLHLQRPQPLVPRSLRFEIRERLDRDGNVITPLDASDVEGVASRLAELNVEAVAICLLHSYRDSAHEDAIGDQLQKTLPKVMISRSSDTAPEIREFDRLSTTVANAYVQPVVSRYLERLEEGLEGLGYAGGLQLVLSEGSAVSARVTRRVPIRLVESGPAAGVRYCQLVVPQNGRLNGTRNLLAFDMGGTTAKACVVRNGTPHRSNVLEAARLTRFMKGSGIPLRVPSIEMIEIGSGGGSIARVDRQHLLKVGPDSAGAVPGPACYGRGGELPTVTDAELILGYLAPESFLGGRLTLDEDAAHRAVETHVASPLNLGVIEAAHGIYQLVGEQMAAAIKVHVAESGADPRTFALVALGGAGPIHASYIARTLGMQGFVCPPHAGVASAIGLLAAPTGFEAFRSLMRPLAELGPDVLRDTFSELEKEVRRVLQESGVDAPVLVGHLDMRFAGQFYEVSVPVKYRDPGALDGDVLTGAFASAYAERYGHHSESETEVVTCRVSGGQPSPIVLAGDSRTSAPEPTGSRSVYWTAQDVATDCSVYDRDLLGPGATIEGPAVLEEAESTVVIEPGQVATVDEALNIVVALGDES